MLKAKEAKLNMSLAINTTTSEGIVLATDSRQSYRNRKGQSRIGSDNAIKLFQFGRKVGVALAGPAFLPEDGVPKNISKFIEEFKRGINIEGLTVHEIAIKIHRFFGEKYQYKKDLEALPEKIKIDLERQGCEILEIMPEKHFVKFRFKNPQGQIQEGTAGVDQLSIIVTGYNLDGSHQSFICYVPGEIELKRDSKQKGKEYGANWIGQLDVVARVVLGRDPRTIDLLLNKGLIREGLSPEGLLEEIKGLEYSISWGTMTLQDAIDFCTLMIQITSAIQRFSDGVVMDPGDIPGVGGPIDIAVITPEKGFVWVSKKNLKIGEKEVDLDDFEDLPKPEKKVKNKRV